jgi:hypothetical protein
VVVHSALTPTSVIPHPTALSERSFNSTQLYGREEARPRKAMELHALDINIASLRGTPKLEQNVPSRTTRPLVCRITNVGERLTWPDET